MRRAVDIAVGRVAEELDRLRTKEDEKDIYRISNSRKRQTRSGLAYH